MAPSLDMYRCGPFAAMPARISLAQHVLSIQGLTVSGSFTQAVSGDGLRAVCSNTRLPIGKSGGYDETNQGGFCRELANDGWRRPANRRVGQCLQSKPQCLHSGYMKPIITRVSPSVGAEKGKRR